MGKTERVAWTVYLLGYLAATVYWLVDLAWPQGLRAGFYLSLAAFSPAGWVWYAAALGSWTLAALSAWPLLGCATGAALPAPEFFRRVFLLRLLFDLLGHRFDLLVLASVWAQSPQPALLSACAGILVIYPSYRALWRAGRNKPVDDKPGRA